MVPLFRVYKNEPVTARKGKKREPAVIGQCGVAMESFTAGCVRAMAVDLLHDAQFPLVFLAPTYQAWKEIPSVVFGDLFCSLGPVDHRVSCTVHRWCSGLRTPWALLRDGSPVILVPGGSGTIECRLSPGYPASNLGHTCTTLIPRRLLKPPLLCPISILALLTPLFISRYQSHPLFPSKTTHLTHHCPLHGPKTEERLTRGVGWVGERAQPFRDMKWPHSQNREAAGGRKMLCFSLGNPEQKQ